MKLVVLTWAKLAYVAAYTMLPNKVALFGSDRPRFFTDSSVPPSLLSSPQLFAFRYPFASRDC